MAVIFNNLQKLSSTMNSGFPKIWGYTDTATTIATMKGVGFFNDFIGTTELKTEDLILVRGSDNTYLYKFIVSGGNSNLEQPDELVAGPYVWRYNINIILDIAATGVVLQWVSVPQGGTLIGWSATVNSGQSYVDPIELNYLGSAVSTLNFPTGQSAGISLDSAMLTTIDTSANNSPAGLQVRVNSPNLTARSYAISIMIGVITTTL